MTAGIVIVGKERFQNTVQGRCVDYNDMIEAFAPDRADQAFNIRTLPSGSGSGENFGDLQVRDLPTEGGAIDAVTVTEQEARGSVPRECLCDLGCRPLGGGMVSHVEMKDAPALMGENEKDKENLEIDGRHDEKSTDANCLTWFSRNERQV